MSEPLAESSQPDPALAVNAALFAGKKIDAINLYRRTHRVDLVTAKQAVEGIEVALRQSHPGEFRYAAKRSDGSVFSMLLFVGSLALLAYGIHWLAHFL